MTHVVIMKSDSLVYYNNPLVVMTISVFYSNQPAITNAIAEVLKWVRHRSKSFFGDQSESEHTCDVTTDPWRHRKSVYARGTVGHSGRK